MDQGLLEHQHLDHGFVRDGHGIDGGRRKVFKEISTKAENVVLAIDVK